MPTTIARSGGDLYLPNARFTTHAHPGDRVLGHRDRGLTRRRQRVSNLMPAATSRAIRLSPIAWAVVTLPARRRVVVEGQAERGLGEHLGGLAVARVAAGDPGVHGAAVALADEVDGEPRLRAAGLVGAVALLDPAEQELPQRRDLGRHRDRAGAERRRRRRTAASWCRRSGSR